MRLFIIALVIVAVVVLGCKSEIPAPQENKSSANQEEEIAGAANESAPEPQKPEEASTKPEIEVKIPNDLLVGDTGILPKNVKLSPGEEVSFRGDGKKRHRIACYSGANRISLSDEITNGGVFTYSFKEPGEYLCVDLIYGLRSTITVESQKLSPTGRVIGTLNTERVIVFAPVIVIAVLAIFAFFSSRRRR
ncbi:hypothetical protein HY638_03075 [Candidatus Woesearchaeota archaeon]|nr:hypothetical protein [Candidatus Woesearchaeota archaeon]